MFWYYISKLSTRETREDSVSSAARTLEAHEGSVVSALRRTRGLDTFKMTGSRNSTTESR